MSKVFLLSVLMWFLGGAALAQEAAAQERGAFESEGVVALYVDADGNLIEIVDEDLQAGRFVFYAWLEDLEGGLDLRNAATAPSDEEKTEFAPSRTQNLVAAFVGYRDDEGNVFPVAGAQVRWVIDEQWEDAIGSTFFGAVDAVGEAGVAGGLGISEDQAITLTNNGNIFNRARFPIATDFPLYNAAGLRSPDIGGVTWVTLFSPDRRARSRVLAVASVNGVEIGKELVTKNFAPRPELQIEKSVTPQSINLVGDEQGVVTFNVTVTNTGSGDATGVVLEDMLTSGNAEAYALVDREGDSFTETFDLPAGESRDFTFRAQANATDTYCNTATIGEFTGDFGETRSPDLTARACFEVITPELNIIKDFVNANGESLGDSVTIDAGEEAILRVRVLNQGSGPAENLVLTDELTSGDAESYSLVNVPEGVNLVNDDAFTAELGTLEAETAITLTYTVTADADGEYCDTAFYTVGGEPGNQDQACLIVATPELTITKVNDQDTVLPGGTYTSTITVTNVGAATARDVVVSDLVGTNTAGDATLVYVSSEVENEAGAFNEAEGLVEAPAAIDLRPEESVVLTVTTRVPERVAPEEFCDIGRYTSANAGSDEIQACVQVPAFAAVQTRMVDDPDPIAAGGDVQYTSTLYVEARSNESIADNQIAFTFGTQEGGQVGEFFEISEVEVFLVPDPRRNPETGLVVAEPSNGVLLTLDEDFSVSSDAPGRQIITLNRTLEPNTALFFVHTVAVAPGTPAGSYGSSYDWSAVGVDSGTQYNPQNSEPTTVINQ